MEVKPRYKQTEVGVIPEEWAVESLASVTPSNARNGIVDGPFGSNLKTIHYRKAGIPITTSGYVTEGHFFAEKYLYVDKNKFDEEKRSAVRPGDIVMAKIGARCGASAILPKWHDIGILSGNALKISVDSLRHSNFYVWQVLWNLYSSGRIEPLKTTGAQPAISMANLKKYKIPLPPSPNNVPLQGL
jgi:type I restriction enzyme S subunit